jgi:hypothetical protein
MLTGQCTGNGCNPVQQLSVQQKVLAQRLAGSEAMSRNDVAQGRKVGRHALQGR